MAAPPKQAFGALIAGYTSAAFLDRALEAMKEFCRQGGVPDARMVGHIVPLCLQQGSYRHAVQVCLMQQPMLVQLHKALLLSLRTCATRRHALGQSSAQLSRNSCVLCLSHAYLTTYLRINKDTNCAAGCAGR